MHKNITAVSALAAAFITSASAIDLVPFGANWDFLHPSDGIDPAIADTDFDTTWFLPAADFATDYNGPAFTADSPAPFGYGTVNYIDNTLGGLATTLATPALGERATAYFRTEFLNIAPIDQLALEILADDGAAIYIDGVLLTTVNFDSIDTWSATTIVTGDETASRSVLGGLGGLAPGTHTLAVSVHQTDTESTDLGFEMRLSDDGLVGLPMGQTEFAGTLATFSLDGSANGWINDSLRSYLLDNADGGTIRSETIDITGRGPLFFSLDFFAEDISVSSNFEDEDTFAARIELDDGAGNITIVSLVPAGWDANADDMLAGDEFAPGLAGEEGVEFRRPLFAQIPAGQATATLVVEAINTSTTEMFRFTGALLTDVAPAGIVLGTADTGAPTDIPLVIGPGLWVETDTQTFELNDSDTDAPLISELIDISALPEALATLTLDVSETSSQSNFESADTFTAWVEVTDAAGLGTAVPLVVGGIDINDDHIIAGGEIAPTAPDEEDVARTYPLSARLPAGSVSARFFISAINNAASETFVVSGVALQLAPPVIDSFPITAVSRGPGTAIDVTWESVSGATYDLQTSTDLTAGTWTTVDTVTATGASSTATHDPGALAETFYRVSRRP